MSGVIRVLCRHSSLSEKDMSKDMLFTFKLKTLSLSALVVELDSVRYAL